MVCPCCAPPCEDENDCEFGECCEEGRCVCSCLSFGGHFGLEGMTVEVDGQEFTIRGDYEGDFIEDPECPGTNAGWSAGQSNDDYCVNRGTCTTVGCGEDNNNLWHPGGSWYLCIRCNINGYGLIPGNCPFWDVVIYTQCEECDPEQPNGLSRNGGNYNFWRGKINMNNSCAPTGEAIDLVLEDSGPIGFFQSEWSECEPQMPVVVFSGNPLP